MSASNMIERYGILFTISRASCQIGSAKAIYDSKKETLSFDPSANILAGDIVSNEFGESYLITKRTMFSERGKPMHIEAKCVDRNEIKPQPSQSVFNIGTVNNSVVGNSNIVNVSVDTIKSQIKERGGEDAEQLGEIVELLEKILNNQEPIKKGAFAKFAGLLEKHSWLSSSIMSAILGFLMR